MDVKADLKRAWQQNPAQTFQLIVRLSEEGSADALKAQGCPVLRRCKLINGYVIQCTGQQAAALAEAPWVTAIELDMPVQAWLCPDKTAPEP
ncbi:MAG: hypothetical protein GXY76_09940 [Chloroflexi bacterium]|nr:hypothetical protein [Chloroflexota bacterium]